MLKPIADFLKHDEQCAACTLVIAASLSHLVSRLKILVRIRVPMLPRSDDASRR
jgi:hypothetical protein